MGAAPLPPPPAEPRAPRRWWALALASILLAVGLLVAGAVYLPIPRGGRTAIGPGRVIGPNWTNASFLEDRTVADELAANLSGGPYDLVGGLAVTSDRASLRPLDASGASGCPLVPTPYPSIVVVEFPRVDGVTGGGLAPDWTFDYDGPGGVGVRIAVVDGQAESLGALMFSSAGCPMSSRPIVNVSTPYDSNSIAMAALEFGGASFLQTYPDAAVTYVLGQGLEPGAHGVLAEEWNVTYLACGVPAGGGAVGSPLGASLTYVFDAESGTLESTASSTFDCPQGADAPIPYELPSALTVNDPVVEFLGGHAVYNATVAMACCGLTYANLTLDLELPGASAVLSGASLTVFNASGVELCVLGGTALQGSEVPCTAPVVAGDLLSLSVPASGASAGRFTLDGSWDFTGAVDVPLANATEIAPA